MIKLKHKHSYKMAGISENDPALADLQLFQNSLLLKELNRQRGDDRLCNMTVIVDGRKFNAHRCVLAASSPYFDSMFRSNMRETQYHSVELQCTSADGMEAILDFMYNGTIDLTAENVFDVICGTDHFMMSELKQYSGRFMAKHLSTSNCVNVRNVAMQYDLPDMLKAANRIIECKLSEVLKKSIESLLKLSCDEVCALVKKEMIEAKEEELFEFIIRWVNHDKTSRKTKLSELLRHIRLGQVMDVLVSLIHPWSNRVESEPLVQEDKKACQLIDEIKRGNVTKGNRKMKKQRPMRMLDVIVFCHHSATHGYDINALSNRPDPRLVPSTFGYVISQNKWVILQDMPESFSNVSLAVEIDNKLITLGLDESTNSQGLKTYLYDPLSNEWKVLPGPNGFKSSGYGHQYSSWTPLVVCNNAVYAFGEDESRKVMMEMYDPEENCWFKKSCDPGLRYGKVFALNDQFLCTIDSDGEIHSIYCYDTHKDEWITLPADELDFIQQDETCLVCPPIAMKTPTGIELYRIW
ncbi:kelch-like protein 3 [Glandiceps talaboti]